MQGGVADGAAAAGTVRGVVRKLTIINFSANACRRAFIRNAGRGGAGELLKLCHRHRVTIVSGILGGEGAQ